MKKKSSALTWLYRLSLVIAAGIMMAPQITWAISFAQRSSLSSGVGYFNVDANGDCSNVGTTVSTAPGSNSPNNTVWSSGLQPPYYLEEFAIETLKDVASKMDVSENDAVTDQHVVSLVGWMWAEGGGLTNPNAFNPLNTGYNDPALLSTAPDASGHQSYKSFDAGVEATARAMTGPFQSRIAAVLTKSDSTAIDFDQALTYFNLYDGNHAWATASIPNYQGNPPDADKIYFSNILASIQQAARTYTQEASLIIDSNGFAARANLHVDVSKLEFKNITVGGDPTSITGADSCQCPSPNAGQLTSLNQNSNQNTANQPVIVLDPGHSAQDQTLTDPQTGLHDHDYPNHPEMEDVYEVAELVQAKLQADGYKVVMTKPAPEATVSLRQRAEIANQNNAALAVSIHDQAGPPASGGLPFADQNNLVIPQEVGLYRSWSDGSHRTTFTNAAVASKSQDFARNIQQARTDAGAKNVTLSRLSFDNRAGIDPGNISMVQLFSNVPWVYNESGGNSAGQIGLSTADKQKYADGLSNGIEKSVPSGGSSSSCSSSASASKIVAQALRDAWTTDHGLQSKPEYAADLLKYDPESNSSAYWFGADCGTFVAVVMRGSGADPGYPHASTVAQAQYVLAHPEKYDIDPSVTDTSKLQPGDILILNQGSFVDSSGHYHVGNGGGAAGHTVVYIGPQSDPNIPKGYNEASASGGDRMGNLGPTQLQDPLGRGTYLRARLKQ